jgi:hypothetical protein
VATSAPYVIERPLTGELADIRSPVRQFFDSRFSGGLRNVQSRYRQSAHALTVPPVQRTEADPGTVGTAADWLLRFLLHPSPSLELATRGAVLCGAQPPRPGQGMLPALEELAQTLGMTCADFRPDRRSFDGPVTGNNAEPGHLARACWVLALLTEVYRGGPVVAWRGPLGQFRGRRPSVTGLLALAPPTAVDQLGQFRAVFESALLPELANRPGMWAIGPTLAGSALIAADADLIAGGLLADLKTSKKLSLGVTDLFQLLGYTLLDYDDEFGINMVGIFSARYAYLATWDIGGLLGELAGQPVSLYALRGQFRELLLRHAPTR